MSNKSNETQYKNVRHIKSILRQANIKKYDPNTVNQLLTFIHNHVSNILEDATEFSKHAGKENIDVSDISLAISYRDEVNPLSRNELIELANEQNVKPLPIIESRDGLRLPSTEICSIGTNYKLIQKKQDRSKSANDISAQQTNAPNSTTIVRKYVCQPPQPSVLSRPTPRFVIKIGKRSTGHN